MVDTLSHVVSIVWIFLSFLLHRCIIQEHISKVPTSPLQFQIKLQRDAKVCYEASKAVILLGEPSFVLSVSWIRRASRGGPVLITIIVNVRLSNTLLQNQMLLYNIK